MNFGLVLLMATGLLILHWVANVCAMKVLMTPCGASGGVGLAEFRGFLSAILGSMTDLAFAGATFNQAYGLPSLLALLKLQKL